MFKMMMTGFPSYQGHNQPRWRSNVAVSIAELMPKTRSRMHFGYVIYGCRWVLCRYWGPEVERGGGGKRCEHQAVEHKVEVNSNIV